MVDEEKIIKDNFYKSKKFTLRLYLFVLNIVFAIFFFNFYNKWVFDLFPCSSELFGCLFSAEILFIFFFG